MLTALLHYVSVENITDLFASHQDPDIISSLGLWDSGKDSYVTLVLRNISFAPIADEGDTLDLGDAQLQFIPAHYLHSSGNFHVYDTEAKILMSGDVGAALEAEGAPMFVKDFDEQIDKMKIFHQRWIPSNRAKQDWINRVRQLDIEVMAPQHGRLFKGHDVKRFLDWLEDLGVGLPSLSKIARSTPFK